MSKEYGVISDREADTILAALRYWQSGYYNLQPEYVKIATEHGRALGPNEIDDLCETINTVELTYDGEPVDGND